MTTEHGGDLDTAIARFGGKRAEWLDLSTGINPHPYPLPQLDSSVWTALPDKQLSRAVEKVGAARYQTTRPVLCLAGAQQAIQIYPLLWAEKRLRLSAHVLYPSYNEHEYQLLQQGWQVTRKTQASQLVGADLAVIVNPNNPDGRSVPPQELLALADRVEFLVIDESFCDPLPDLSVCPHLTAAHDNVLVLRSFGKFYGLAGARLGFAIGEQAVLDKMADRMGSWAVSGPSLAIGKAALGDQNWATRMREQLAHDAHRLDQIAALAGWQTIGGTSLFRLYQMTDARHWQEHLARQRIWARSFSYNDEWLRLGLPPASGWDRLQQAIIR